MAPRRRLARGVLAACALALEKRALALEAGASAGSSGAAIPEWRVDAALHPSRTLQTLLSDKKPTADTAEPTEQTVSHLTNPMGSTLGQDRQRCPLVKLPATVLSTPEQAGWSGQSGVWESVGNNVRLASWGQNYFSQGWETIHIRNQDGSMALKAEFRSLADLREMYGWRPGSPVSSYPNITSLESRAEAGAYHGFRVVSNEPNEVEVVAIKPPQLGDFSRIMAFSDCEGQLLFVCRFEEQTPRERPALINVFDRAGNLLAHSIVNDPTITRYQFVDPNGYLLAVAESPGLHQNIPTSSIPLDPSKGNVMPFEIQFEPGGYVNASRLLDLDYHWVLVTAVQAVALADSHEGWTPRLSSAVTVICWCLAALGLLSCLFAGFAMYRLVYPLRSGTGTSQQPLWMPGKVRYTRDVSYDSFNKAV